MTLLPSLPQHLSSLEAIAAALGIEGSPLHLLQTCFQSSTATTNTLPLRSQLTPSQSTQYLLLLAAIAEVTAHQLQALGVSSFEIECTWIGVDIDSLDIYPENVSELFYNWNLKNFLREYIAELARPSWEKDELDLASLSACVEVSDTLVLTDLGFTKTITVPAELQTAFLRSSVTETPPKIN